MQTVVSPHQPPPLPPPQAIDGRVPNAPAPELLNQMIPQGRYLADAIIGMGGMGVVYRGIQVSLNRPVALKLLRKGDGAAYAFEDRFRREAIAMGQLAHPNIVAIYDFDVIEQDAARAGKRQAIKHVVCDEVRDIVALVRGTGQPAPRNSSTASHSQ